MRLTIRGSRLRVTNIDSDDNSIIFLFKNTIQTLKLSHGDIVLVKGKNRRATILTILADEDLDDGNARMNNVARYNLDVKDSDIITIQPCLDIKCAKCVTILPITNNIEGITSHIFDVLTLYFDKAYRPIRQGDLLIVLDDMGQVYFKVVKVDP